jgi:T-complex protein 1 subunit alpha
VKSTGADGSRVTYPVSAINVLKAHGKSARESALLNGYALNLGRASQGMPKRVSRARIACLDMNLQKTRMHMGIQARRRLSGPSLPPLLRKLSRLPCILC